MLTWILLGILGWVFGLLFVMILMRMAGDEDRSARHEEKRLDPDNRPEGTEVDNTDRTFDVDRGQFTDSEDYDESEPAPFSDPEDPNNDDDSDDKDEKDESAEKDESDSGDESDDSEDDSAG